VAESKQIEREVFEQRATIESWDEDYYHPIAERYYDRAVAQMLRLMEAEPGARVLDAGCGPGVHSVRVARAGYRVCAIDISQAMLDEARARVSAAGLGAAVEFRHEDLTRLSLPDASFRFVFSWGVIIHIHEVEKALDELARVVEPGGKLALYVTNSSAWDLTVESWLRFLLRRRPLASETLRLGSGVWYELHGQKLWLWRFDIRELERQLQARGFELAHRVVGQFSELQRRVHGPLRRVLLRWNNLCFRLQAPAGPAVTNLLVFRKHAPPNPPR
jgi:2-polyprenyl-3-methyl-5-hydroxy-6-metoxy-1,4-benzoquinol methylase